jgi:hypothetical protein
MLFGHTRWLRAVVNVVKAVKRLDASLLEALVVQHPIPVVIRARPFSREPRRRTWKSKI